MKSMRTMADLRSDPRISEVNDERRDGMGLWAYANDRDGYFIEGGSDTGSYVQIHEDSLREVLKQANRIKHLSEFSESEKENLRQWAKSNDYTLKENPMKKNPMHEDPLDAMFVEYMRPMQDEEPFMMGGSKYEFVRARYPDGRMDIGVYSQRGDVTYGYRHWRQMMGIEKMNPVKSRKENYDDFDEWETDAFRAGATQVVRIGEDLFSAIKMKDGSLVKLDKEGFVDMRSRAGQKVRKDSITVGSWYGNNGEIYRQTIRNNPLTRRKGETVRDFTARCMSEEKASFPKTKQRIAVCLSKNRRRNPLESGATISDDEDINDRASNMG